MINLEEMLQPGKSIRLYYYEGNLNNEMMHIRAIVDDTQVVYRCWNKRWQSWRYNVKHIIYFERWNMDGYLSDGEKKRQKRL